LLMVGMHGSYVAFMKFGNRVYLRATERISDPEVPKMTVMVTGAADCEAGDSIPPGSRRDHPRDLLGHKNPDSGNRDSIALAATAAATTAEPSLPATSGPRTSPSRSEQVCKHGQR
jgi:hypothetical protein